jgi:hypothetical protein
MKLRRPVRQRLPATVVAVIVLLCQSAAWVHAAATPHVTCLEHGESIHLAAVTTPARAGEPTVVSTPAVEVVHAHEHCNIQGQRTTSTSSPAPTFVRACPARAIAPPTLLAVRPVGLLRFAPKTSPPAPTSA